MERETVQEMTILYANAKSHLLLANECCLEFMKGLKSNSVDLVLADPPYGVTRCAWDKIIDPDALWKGLLRVTKPNTAIILFCVQPFTSVLVHSNLRHFKYQLVWAKNRATGFLNAKKQPLRICEDVLIFYRKQPVYSPQKTIGRKPVNKNHKESKPVGVYNSLKGLKGVFGGNIDRHPTNLLRFPVVSNDGYGERRYKPTQKPVALLEYLIKTYSNPGGTVFDFCFGSGSAAIACANTDRDFIGSEISRSDYLVACERLSEKVPVSLEVL